MLFFYATYFLWGGRWSGQGVNSGKTLPKAQRTHDIEYFDLFNTSESSGMDLL